MVHRHTGRPARRALMVFTAPKLKLDIFVGRKHGNAFAGKVVAMGPHGKTTLALACTEL